MPLLKNNAKRLITLNGPHTNQTVDGKVVGIKPGDKYDMLPAGGAVEVPKSVADMPYTKALIKTSDVIVVSQDESNGSDDSQFASMTKPELVSLAESMNIEIESRDTKADIIAKIESVE